jgi:predicted Fe-Mo cluster-binding NifX family protein
MSHRLAADNEEAGMRLCIPTIDERGLAGRLSPHFGSTPFFTIVDVAAGTVEVFANAQARHEHGQCRPAAALEGRAVDAVVCSGLGRGAFAVLAEAGYRVYLTTERDVLRAVDAFVVGRLQAATPDRLCEGSLHAH